MLYIPGVDRIISSFLDGFSVPCASIDNYSIVRVMRTSFGPITSPLVPGNVLFVSY